jgi:nucleoside-diphosphate-sugar epimerase
LPSNQNPLGARPARFRRQRLLIIGCGDVGQRVAKAQRGVRLLALTSSPERCAELRAQGITPLLGNLDDPRSLRRLAGLGTRVLHLAPPPAASEETPRWWLDPRTTALVQALRRRGLPQGLVYASTSGVYGDCGGAWVDESRPPAAHTGRAMRRVNAERTLRWLGRQGLRASILRIPGIYAPDRVGGTPRARLLRGTPVLRSEDDVYTNHIHADDLARACQAALWRGSAQRIYNVADASVMHMGDYFDFAADLYGLPRPPRVSRSQAQGELPLTLLSFMGESRRLRTTRMERELRVALRYPTVAQGLQGKPVR